jgi:hypothetical protein
MRFISVSSNDPPPARIRSAVAASAFQSCMIDFNRAAADATPTVQSNPHHRGEHWPLRGDGKGASSIHFRNLEARRAPHFAHTAFHAPFRPFMRPSGASPARPPGISRSDLSAPPETPRWKCPRRGPPGAGGPLRERSQLQSLQSLQLRAEQRRDRPLRAGSATAGRGGEAFVGRHRSVWVFLGPPHLAAKTPVYEGWNSLDFLGFSRQNLDLSMGYAGFSTDILSRALPSARSRDGLLLSRPFKRTESFMEQAYPNF